MSKGRALSGDNFPQDELRFSSLVELLRYRSQTNPDQLIYTFLADGETATASLTYRQLDQRARAIGSLIQQRVRAGERVLLLFPPGLEFVTAFFGALYGGAIAIPACPPHPARPTKNISKLLSIVKDARPRFVLTTTSLLSVEKPLCQAAAEFGEMAWIGVENIADTLATEWQEQLPAHDSLAFLQYTSGSTGDPKGVMVSHGNIMHNSASIKAGFHHTEQSIAVTWLPSFHDMGLIDGILQPVYCGFPTYIMPPTSFLQRPLRWLQAITKYRATHSGGPNFAYDLCARSITPAQRATLDLSSWQVAYNGAEPIRQETLAQFNSAFAECGFQQQAFYPCYGLAEGTLKITGGTKQTGLSYLTMQANGLENYQTISNGSEKAITHIACGSAAEDMKIAIVDVETLMPCPPDKIGEIWVSGPSIAQGYWQRPAATLETFQARLANGDNQTNSDDQTTYLRTGDLGLMKDGELYITGRRKDLIIIRGRNYYPQDIEWSVENCHGVLRIGASAAFSINVDGEERLVIAAEVDRHYKPARGGNDRSLFDQIKNVVAENFDLQIHEIVLLKLGSIPKTSSGKIQRHACRKQYLNHELEIVDNWTAQSQISRINTGQLAEQLTTTTTPAAAISDDFDIDYLSIWLKTRVAEKANLPINKIDLDESLINYGLDSMASTALAQELSDRFALSVSATLVWDYPTINLIARYLANRLSRKTNCQPKTRANDYLLDPMANLLNQLTQISDDEAERLVMESSRPWQRY